MTRPLIIIGTGGNALDFVDVVEAINRYSSSWALQGLLDDTRTVGSEFHGLPVLGPLSRAKEYRGSMFVNAIGSDRSFQRRQSIIESAGLSNADFATLIHPGACVSKRSQVGVGSVVNFGVSVGGDVEIGRHVTIGPNCAIGHNAVIDDFAILAPAAVVSGYVRIGKSSYIGAGAAIKQKVSIGLSALVGLGAVVTKDVADEAVVIGNPARPLKRIQPVLTGAK